MFLQIFSLSTNPDDNVKINYIAWMLGSSNYFTVSGTNVAANEKNNVPFALYEYRGVDISFIGAFDSSPSYEGWDVSWNPLFNARGLVAISGYPVAYLFQFEVRNGALIFSEVVGSSAATPLVQWSIAHLALYDQVNEKIIVVSFGAANHVEYCNVHGVHGEAGSFGIASSDYLANFFANNRAWDNDRNYSDEVNSVNGYSASSYENVSYA